MHDVPYIKSQSIGPEIISAMTKICSDVKINLPPNIPCGLQVHFKRIKTQININNFLFISFNLILYVSYI